MRRFQVDEGISLTLTRLTHYFIMAIGALIAFQFLGVDLSGLAVIFGFLSVGIGFGLQNITSNFIAGLILLFERPIKIGDRVLVHDTEGDVLDINIRSTTIRSLQNVDIIVPNSDFISNAVVNWSHGDLRIRMSIDVGVSYSSNIDDVLTALAEVGREHPDVIKDPAPRVMFRSFGDSSWNMSLVVWTHDASEHHRLRSDLNIAIVRKFRDFGIEIPFPQRDLHLRSATTLPVETHPEKQDQPPPIS
jgi:small-conductance mechanosensitive channel